ncbi:thermonuclease family protein [Paenibacillus guangzhouensis]|uniref:thermonuclease family protein n=1 Tax=Paenibacillus guangzhouensis TaxID=1473112 RepID=UPI0012676264|nr:thermonuclease family protein [Paenibacillus guangzhouensis]
MNLKNRFKNSFTPVRLTTAILLIFIIVLTGCSTASTNAGDTNAKVVKVVDGDTLDVEFNGKTERIRLLLVDTPETVHPSKPVEPFGPEASKFAKETLSNQRVKVEFDVSERDKYGRLLAYVWIDGKMFNELLLEKGLARVAYVYPPNVKYVDQFRAIQSKAQKAELGIWSIENYATDRGFDDAAAKKSEQGAKSTTKAKDTSATDNAKKPSTIGSCKKPTIKGNISSKGDKIYHVPGGQSYESTKAEEMFCSEADAEAAGFRKAKR